MAYSQSFAPLMIGQTISHYRIIDKLGSGGMGVVFEAEDVRLGRRVALKLLHEKLAREPRAIQRFEREARAASSLNHPGICTIYEVEEHNQQPVIVMELLQGESLKQRIGKGPVSADEVLNYGIQICDALQAAHAKGIIHRDIKPGNIFIIESGRLKVLDFGLAKMMPCHVPEEHPNEDSLTVQGVIPGTTVYMSPEQARGEEVDVRSDLFSLGVVLYELATGVRPFTGKNSVLIIDAILNASARPPSLVNPALPTGLDAIIDRALEKNREQRYQQASEIKHDLEQLKAEKDRTNVPTPPSSLQEPRRASKKWNVTAVVGFITVFLFVALIFLYLRRPRVLTEKDTIVLADFDNRTGDPVFDDTLKQALAVELEQSPFLNILSEQKINTTLRLMDREAGSQLMGPLARELCQRVGSKVVLEGSIVSLGRHYAINLKASNCTTGDPLATEQMEATGKEQVLNLLGKAARDLRSRLGESLSSIQNFATPIEEATTPSLDALKAYSMARKTWATNGESAALPFLKQAVELDPNFALAYGAMGTLYNNLGQVTLATENAKRAYQLREKVSEHERLRIEVYYYFVTGELEKALEVLQVWQQTYPREMAAYNNMAQAYNRLGKHEQSLQPWQQAMRLDPNNSDTYDGLCLAYLFLDRVEDAEAVYHQALDHNLVSEFMLLDGYWVTFVKGNEAELERFVATAHGNATAEQFLLMLRADTEGWHGHIERARILTQQAVDLAMRNGTRDAAASYLAIGAMREAMMGNRKQTDTHASAALKLASDRDVLAFTAWAYAQLGDTPRASSLAAELDRRFPQATLAQSYWLPTIRAEIALQQNNPKKSLELLGAAAPYELSAPTELTAVALCPAYVRGRAYLALRDGKAAVAEFQKFRDHRGLVANFPLGALSRMQLGHAYAMQGSRSQAREAFEEFLRLWKDADTNVPIFNAAKAEYAKLQQ